MSKVEPFLTRNCPCCGSASAVPEAQSEKHAEKMGLDELSSYWAGLFKQKVFFSYNRCQDCGLLYAPVFFDQGQLETLYAQMAPNMEDVKTEALEATQRGYWDTARKSLTVGGSYLEIGPDIGYIARHAAAEGDFDHFWLFEPNRAVHTELAASTGDRPNTISTAMDDLSAVPDESVALAVIVHVLDHVLDPIALLRNIHAKLKPGGVLVTVTHNEASLLRKVMAEKWPPFCLQHPEIYNPKSIAEIMRRAKYSSVKVARSTNHFPISFMVRQAAWTVGVKLDKVPLPTAALGLKLGNIITVAHR